MKTSEPHERTADETARPIIERFRGEKRGSVWFRHCLRLMAYEERFPVRRGEGWFIPLRLVRPRTQ